MSSTAHRHSPPRAAIATVWVMRCTALLHATLLVSQPVLAGRFLDGHYPALAQHYLVGVSLMGTANLLWLSAIALAWPGRLGWIPLVVCTAMALLMPVQLGMGQSRMLAVHLALGVSLVAGGVGMAIWVWWPRRAARSHRPRRTRVSAVPA